MKVVLERVDARRYRIGIVRDGRHDVGPDVPVRPAPGPADVPHDLVHFVVEEQLGLRLGIYGQLAAGGDVGFFVPAPGDRHPAADRRRSDRIGRAGRPDAARSEHVAALLHTGRFPPGEGVLPPRERAAIERRLAALLAQWAATAPGEQLILTWPDELTVRRGVLPGGIVSRPRSRGRTGRR